MRTLILLAIFTCSTIFDLHAQETDKPSRIILGVQGGGVLSRASEKENSYNFEQYSTLRPVFGVYADIGANHAFSLRTGLSYLFMGNRAKYPGVVRNAKIDYLAVPLLIKYKTRKSELAVFTGMQFAFLMSAESRASNTVWKDIKSESGQTDLMGILGISIEPKNSPVNFSLSGHLGFKRVYTEFSGSDLYNRGFTLAIQYELFHF